MNKNIPILKNNNVCLPKYPEKDVNRSVVSFQNAPSLNNLNYNNKLPPLSKYFPSENSKQGS
jgi:hypothetical protein